MEVKILRERDVNPELEHNISLLMKQLNPELKPPSLSHIIPESGNLYILCAFEGKELLGMATLAVYRVLSGEKGWIEDVVVDQKHRRKGVARILTEQLIQLSRDRGLDQLMLYTGTHRKAAQQLYEQCGFSKKNSYLYILIP